MEELIYLAIAGLALYAIAAYDSYLTAKSKSKWLDLRFKRMIEQDTTRLQTRYFQNPFQRIDNEILR